MTYAGRARFTDQHFRPQQPWRVVVFLICCPQAGAERELSPCLQEGARAAVVFCQQGSTTLRCVQVAQLAPAKGSKEKPGGQLRTDNKKPIVALAAAPCQKLEVIVLYVDGSLSNCICSPATRVMATRWCIAVDPGAAALHQVRQRTPITPDPALLGNRTGMSTQPFGGRVQQKPCRVPAVPQTKDNLSGCTCNPATGVMATPLACCNGPPGLPSLTGAHLTLPGNRCRLHWPPSWTISAGLRWALTAICCLEVVTAH